MSFIEISQRDINRSKIVEPAWYRVKIETVGEAISSKGDSTNYLVEGFIMHNADTGDKTFTEVPTPYWNLNSKFKGAVIDFLKAADKGDITPGRYSPKNAEGKEIEVFIGNEMYEGRLVNSIKHQYRAARD